MARKAAVVNPNLAAQSHAELAALEALLEQREHEIYAACVAYHGHLDAVYRFRVRVHDARLAAGRRERKGTAAP